MYWVHWNTRKAKLARKSLAESRPATGRNMNPVRSACARERKKTIRPQSDGDRRVLRRLLLWPVSTFQEAGDVLQLRDVVWAVATMSLQQPEGLEVFAAGVGDVQVSQC